MALSSITPVASSVILAGDGITFSTPDSATSVIVTITADAGAETAYSGAGAGAGYTVTTSTAGGFDTYTIKRDLGWDLEPQVINVAVVDGGAYAEEWSYYLGTQRLFPQGSNPLNPIYVGSLIVTENNVQVRDDVGWIEFDPATFNVADSGSGKVTVTAVATGTGDVVGPASATNDALVVWDGTSGELVKDSTGTIAQIVANTAKATNATHSGDVSGATTLTIGAKKVTAAMMEDGTDGELFTWDASGVLAKVPVGTSSHVLTSNGAGAAPTFQASAAGTTLDGVINAGTPDNDVDVPVANPIFFRDGAAALTPLSIAKTHATATTPVVHVQHANSDGIGITVEETAVGSSLNVHPDKLIFKTTSVRSWFIGDDGNGGDDSNTLEIMAGWARTSGTGGTLSLSAGPGVSGATNGIITLDNATEVRIVDCNGLTMAEAADHPATPTAGFGQIWIKSDTPNTLWFTDDAGTDTQLGASGGGASTFSIPVTFEFKPVDGSWAGPEHEAGWIGSDLTETLTYGTGAVPVPLVYTAGIVIPVDCNLVAYSLWHRVGAGSTHVDMGIHKWTKTDASSTISTAALVGTLDTTVLQTGLATTNQYLIAETGLTEALSRNDELGIFYDGQAGTSTSSVFVSGFLYFEVT